MKNEIIKMLSETDELTTTDIMSQLGYERLAQDGLFNTREQKFFQEILVPMWKSGLIDRINFDSRWRLP